MIGGGSSSSSVTGRSSALSGGSAAAGSAGAGSGSGGAGGGAGSGGGALTVACFWRATKVLTDSKKSRSSSTWKARTGASMSGAASPMTTRVPPLPPTTFLILSNGARCTPASPM
ncbi:MAG TPA: hypothetical protein ENJ85_04175 [Oceanithermus profundus]|uniref:Uncharacterized protein n=1 Tax=Oceanithermus profundus TaxID=187137 RepID=A0A7C5WTJ5_9DEIN|nr:hypothetical protein [Oceanithermus profundus]